MQTYLFSSPMLPIANGTGPLCVFIRQIPLAEAKTVAAGNIISAVQNETIADYLSDILCAPVPVQRFDVRLTPGCRVLRASVQFRLPTDRKLSGTELEKAIKNTTFDLCEVTRDDRTAGTKTN